MQPKKTLTLGRETPILGGKESRSRIDHKNSVIIKVPFRSSKINNIPSRAVFPYVVDFTTYGKNVKMLTFRYVITVSILNGYHTYISKAFELPISRIHDLYMKPFCSNYATVRGSNNYLTQIKINDMLRFIAKISQFKFHQITTSSLISFKNIKNSFCKLLSDFRTKRGSNNHLT